MCGRFFQTSNIYIWLVLFTYKSIRVQLMAKFTLMCAIHVCVVQFYSSGLLELTSHMSLTFHAVLESALSTTCKLDFVCFAYKIDFSCCTQVRVKYYI